MVALFLPLQVGNVLRSTSLSAQHFLSLVAGVRSGAGPLDCELALHPLGGF